MAATTKMETPTATTAEAMVKSQWQSRASPSHRYSTLAVRRTSKRQRCLLVQSRSSCTWPWFFPIQS